MTTISMMFLVGLLGSFHCVAMCGPFVGYYSVDAGSRTWLRHGAYHIGRLIAYGALGSIAGALGQGILTVGAALTAQKVLAIGMGVVMIGLGLLGLFMPQFGAGGVLSAPIQKVLAYVNRMPRATGTAFLIGLFSTLLPCGFLYSFALAAATTGQAFHGFLVMFGFWLGTLPALVGLGIATRLVSRQLLARFARMTPVFLILFGFLAISGKWVGIPGSGETPLCHQIPGM